MCRTRYTGPLAYAMAGTLVLCYIILAAGIGLAARFAGGWHARDLFNYEASGSSMGVGIVLRGAGGRWLVGAAAGLGVALLLAPWTRSQAKPRRRLAFLVVTAVFVALPRYAEPLCYSSMGMNELEAALPSGPFDWLVGSVGSSWSFDWRWTRDLAGLSMHGVLQSAPVGLWLLLFGYGWEVLAAGALMGPCYLLGTVCMTPAGAFGAGLACGQLVWGTVFGLVLLWCCLRYGWQPQSEANLTGPCAGADSAGACVGPSGDDVPVSPRAGVIALALGIWLALVASAVWYGAVQSSSTVFFAQTELALCFACLAMPLSVAMWHVSRSDSSAGCAPDARPAFWDDVTDDDHLRVFGVQDGGLHGSALTLGDRYIDAVLTQRPSRLYDGSSRVLLGPSQDIPFESSALLGEASWRLSARPAWRLSEFWGYECALTRYWLYAVRLSVLGAWLVLVPCAIVAAVRQFL